MDTTPNLIEIGNAIRDQLHALVGCLDPKFAANVVVNLEGARREVLRYRERLMHSDSEGGPEPPATTP